MLIVKLVSFTLLGFSFFRDMYGRFVSFVPPLPDILLLLSSWDLQAFVWKKSEKGSETNYNHLHVRQCFIVCIYLCLFHLFFLRLSGSYLSYTFH